MKNVEGVKSVAGGGKPVFFFAADWTQSKCAAQRKNGMAWHEITAHPNSPHASSYVSFLEPWGDHGKDKDKDTQLCNRIREEARMDGCMNEWMDGWMDGWR